LLLFLEMYKALCLLLFVPVFSWGQLEEQSSSKDFEIVAYWGPDESYLYQIEKITTTYLNGQLQKTDTAIYEALFEVIDSTETHYELAWTVMGSSLQQLSLPDTILQKLSSLANKELGYVYRTDEVGSFLALTNHAEVRLAMLEQFAVIEDMFSEPAERQKFINTLAPFKDLLVSNEGIEALVAKELQLFHLLYGLAVDSGEHFDYDEALPNLFGGAPITGKGKLYHTTTDTSEGRFTMINEMRTDPKSTKAFLKQALPIMVPTIANNKDFKKVLKKSSIQIIDRQVFELYYGYCLPHLIQSERKTELVLPTEQRIKIEQLNIRLQYN
jgi:hypothetical protein